MNTDECIHLLDPATCSICSPRNSPKRASRRSVDESRPVHLVIKWSPARESNTLERHMAVASAVGSSWWGCESDSADRRAAPERVERLQAQVDARILTWAYVYRTGAPSVVEAEVWRAGVTGVQTDAAAIDPRHRPAGMSLESSFLFVELSGFERVPQGWVLDHLERYDEPGQLLDAGALGNQTSPLYVAAV